MTPAQARQTVIDALLEHAVDTIALDHSYLRGILKDGIKGLNDMSDQELIEDVTSAELYDDREVVVAVRALRENDE